MRGKARLYQARWYQTHQPTVSVSTTNLGPVPSLKRLLMPPKIQPGPHISGCWDTPAHPAKRRLLEPSHKSKGWLDETHRAAPQGSPGSNTKGNCRPSIKTRVAEITRICPANVFIGRVLSQQPKYKARMVKQHPEPQPHT